jgi:hypothetical protein
MKAPASHPGRRIATKRPWRFLLAAALLIAALATAMIIAHHWATRAPAAAAHSFLVQTLSGQQDSAYASTSSEFKGRVRPEEFAEQYAIAYASVEVRLGSIDRDGEHARVDGSVRVNNNLWTPFTITLVREQDQWKVEAHALGL